MSQGISEQDISKQEAEEQKTAKPKHIVLLSDGTGNSSAKVFKTNVWRLFQILDLRDPTSQIAYYDDGVGTSSFKAFAILGGVFGFGLKRNVIDIYSFCCRNYKAGDYIYCFGFSRGAFTIRVVAGMIARQGLVEYNNNEADLARSWPPMLTGFTGAASPEVSSNSFPFYAIYATSRSGCGAGFGASRQARPDGLRSRVFTSWGFGTQWMPMVVRSRR